MRRVFSPLLPTVLVLLFSAQLALAAKPIHENFVFNDTFTEDLCGIEVTTQVQVKVNSLSFEDRFMDLSVVQVTWTNDEGDWLQNFAAGPGFLEEQLDGDILTITERHAGVHERLRSSTGLTAAFDRGQIVFRIVIDLNDPEDFEDDVLLSFETLFQAGPHPEADSDFALFCDVVHDVLG